ncbi:MAG: NAD-dependent epimerase/dehydratase family protein [Sphingomonadaceae bacterium]
MTAPNPVVIIGGQSRAGRAIRARLADRPVISVVRTSHSDGDVAIGRYDAVPSGLIPRGAVVINCVGTPLGDPTELAQINCATPVRWAEAARESGAVQFIQLSSFSIFGRAEHIAVATAIAPVDAYGRSKWAAETALAALACPSYPVTLLRIPILIGCGVPGKLQSLLEFVRRTRMVPRLLPAPRRSMLSYDGLGAAVSKAMYERLDGAVIVADPEPFTYDLIARVGEEIGIKFARPTVPRILSRAIRTFNPVLGYRLFSSMVVADSETFLVDAPPFTRLRQVIADTLTTVRLQ